MTSIGQKDEGGELGRVRKIPINDLSRSTSAEVRDAAALAISSGVWVHGPEHAVFQKEFADYLGVNHFFGVASGTDAIEIALRAVGCGWGSKVITVANAGGYTTVAATLIGCEVIFCDIDPITHLISIASLKEILSEEIDAVVVTHLYGNIAPIPEIVRLCKKFGVKVIEDCAQAVGGSIDDQSVGYFGDVSTFSFYPTKNLGALGDGGGVATNNLEYAESIHKLRQYGWNEKYKIETLFGRNSRLDEIQAAVLRRKLPGLDLALSKRREILNSYNLALEKSEINLVSSFSPNSAAHLAIVSLPQYLDREDFRKRFHDLGIATDIHYPVLDSDQIAYKNQRDQTELRVSRLTNPTIVTLPLFPEMTDAEVRHVCNGLLSIS